MSDCRSSQRAAPASRMRWKKRSLTKHGARSTSAPGWRERTPLYQLYPLLVHVVLFGGSYVGAVERALDAYV